VGLVADTSALVALERGLEAELPDERVVMPTIVYAELLAGVALTNDAVRAAERRAKVAAVANVVPIVDFDRRLAERWAEIVSDLRRRGETIPSNDAQVAATALELGFGVLVGPPDDAHFCRIHGLEVHALGG
jgi:predicted nucleic acid-binding protein